MWKKKRKKRIKNGFEKENEKEWKEHKRKIKRKWKENERKWKENDRIIFWKAEVGRKKRIKNVLKTY